MRIHQAKILDKNYRAQKRIEMEIKKQVERTFERKKKKLGLEATLELDFIDDFPVIGEYVYGEAFPKECRVTLDVFAPFATNKEITETVCEELMHIKHPELKHGPKFWRLVRECMSK